LSHSEGDLVRARLLDEFARRSLERRGLCLFYGVSAFFRQPAKLGLLFLNVSKIKSAFRILAVLVIHGASWLFRLMRQPHRLAFNTFAAVAAQYRNALLLVQSVRQERLGETKLARCLFAQRLIKPLQVNDIRNKPSRCAAQTGRAAVVGHACLRPFIA
jgi:hypothetical protein